VLVREQKLLTAVLSERGKVLPFVLLGFDTDNGSVFMNETVRDYCTGAGVEFTRSRPHRKNDQAWVKQKNGAASSAMHRSPDLKHRRLYTFGKPAEVAVRP